MKPEQSGRTTIYAQLTGTISMLNVELVSVFRNATNDWYRNFKSGQQTIWVEVDVNENDIVKVGDDANVEVDAYLKKQFKSDRKYF
jgi:HlyD family secretion protein